MNDYLLLFRGGNNEWMGTSPAEAQAEMEKWTKWMGSLAAEGKLGPSQPLQNSGKVVTGTDKVVTDGPYMDGRETVGGYLQCKAASYEEAIEIAKGCPILEQPSGTVEVREILSMNM